MISSVLMTPANFHYAQSIVTKAIIVGLPLLIATVGIVAKGITHLVEGHKCNEAIAKTIPALPTKIEQLGGEIEAIKAELTSSYRILAYYNSSIKKLKNHQVNPINAAKTAKGAKDTVKKGAAENDRNGFSQLEK